jgi:hypothetical protein
MSRQKQPKVTTKDSSAQDDPEQSKRFLEAARKAGADETEKGAERAFNKVIAKPKRGQS